MLIMANDNAQKALAADIAALLEERDPLSDSNDTDINRRVTDLREARRRHAPGRWRRVALIAEQYQRMVRVAEDNQVMSPYDVGTLIALAYPERIAKAEPDGTYKLANGEHATLDTSDSLHGYAFLAIAAVGRKIFLASPVAEEAIARLASPHERVAWDDTLGRVTATREWRIGSIVLSEKPMETVTYEQAIGIVSQTIKREGRSLLRLTDSFFQQQRRIATCAQWHPELALPDVSPDALFGKAEDWLPMYVGRTVTATELRKIDMTAVLWAQLSYEQQQAVERLAPSHIEVPTGSRIRIDYREGADAPVLSVRLQECFGMTDTPRVDNGTRPVLMELLSPGFKPVQLTQDLRSFWNDTYFEVRKEMRRRYPKHHWPDNPLEAEAVRGVRRKANNTGGAKQ